MSHTHSEAPGPKQSGPEQFDQKQSGQRALCVNIIGKSNGVGLSRDLDLLGDALRSAGCEVRVVRIDRDGAHTRRSVIAQWRTRLQLAFRSSRQSPPADVNIMLEHVWVQHLPFARYNVAVPNPEWFDRHDQRFVTHVDYVWAKTRYTQQIFQALGRRALYVGFDSQDRHDPAVARRRTYFHLAGKSDMKGTDRLLRVWSRHPEWPTLVTAAHKPGLAAPSAGNIRLVTGYQTDVQLRTLQNESVFHICPSLTEGWGHYIVEALSVGAVTITTGAAPMNELVTQDRGVLVDARVAGRQRLATTHHVEDASLEAAIERTLTMPEQECADIGARARQWFLENKNAFPQRVRSALAQLNSPAPLRMAREASSHARLAE